MKGLFNADNPVMQFLSRTADLIILNICFLIGCIPLITIGTSLTALYSVSLKMVRNEEGGIISGFWKAWRSNFRQSTAAWLLTLLAGAFLGFEYSMIMQMTGALRSFFFVIWLLTSFVIAAGIWFLFPYMARFEDRLPVCIANAFRFSVLHILYTAVSLLILGIFAAFSFWTPAVFGWMLLFWLMIGFALAAYAHSYSVRSFFEPFEIKPENEEGMPAGGDEETWPMKE